MGIIFSCVSGMSTVGGAKAVFMDLTGISFSFIRVIRASFDTCLNMVFDCAPARAQHTSVVTSSGSDWNIFFLMYGFPSFIIL